VSCKRRSILLLLSVIPVRPPKVNKNKNPKLHKKTGDKTTKEPNKVPNQEKTLIPVGTAITIVAAVK
jgi:hypothetical protein